ncbi:probable small nuclear ribonucleoprotein F [Zingiber officinale]|uniref:probable small nuclear ribonucleoprotein F n=1 Tax=Zingiber officinale TaxID=94328 RepID=UPI001C4BC965|nr:probable small nuclear ribonucleoprotein F [Zingiber officinale]
MGQHFDISLLQGSLLGGIPPGLLQLFIEGLANTEEFIDGQFTGNLGEILIRCNNVLYLRGVPEDEEIEDAD